MQRDHIVLDLNKEQIAKLEEFYFRNGKFIDAHLISMKVSEWNRNYY